MSKMCLAYLGLFLLALSLLSSQVVQAQNSTEATMNATMTPSVNITTDDKNSCGRTDVFTLLLPLALGTSLLHAWW